MSVELGPLRCEENLLHLGVSSPAAEEWSLTQAAVAAEVSERTAGKWVGRFRQEGEAGLLDRPSAARQVHNRTP